MSIVAVLPARLESRRLARKLLLSETGKPLICHTVEQVLECRLIDRVIVATDSLLIRNAVGSLCEVMLTKLEHQSGTERIAECVYRLEERPEIIAGIQADEPEIDPSLIDSVITLLANSNPDIATACTPLSADEIDDPSAVKVTLDGSVATRFSRQWKPGARRHVGLYVYRPEYLKWFTRTPRTRREIAESLEQLRAFESGRRIECVKAIRAHKGIDCESDYRAFCERHRQTVGPIRTPRAEHLPQHG